MELRKAKVSTSLTTDHTGIYEFCGILVNNPNGECLHTRPNRHINITAFDKDNNAEVIASTDSGRFTIPTVSKEFIELYTKMNGDIEDVMIRYEWRERKGPASPGECSIYDIIYVNHMDEITISTIL